MLTTFSHGPPFFGQIPKSPSGPVDTSATTQNTSSNLVPHSTTFQTLSLPYSSPTVTGLSPSFGPVSFSAHWQTFLSSPYPLPFFLILLPLIFLLLRPIIHLLFPTLRFQFIFPFLLLRTLSFATILHLPSSTSSPRLLL